MAIPQTPLEKRPCIVQGVSFSIGAVLWRSFQLENSKPCTKLGYIRRGLRKTLLLVNLFVTSPRARKCAFLVSDGLFLIGRPIAPCCLSYSLHAPDTKRENWSGLCSDILQHRYQQVLRLQNETVSMLLGLRPPHLHIPLTSFERCKLSNLKLVPSFVATNLDASLPNRLGTCYGDSDGGADDESNEAVGIRLSIGNVSTVLVREKNELSSSGGIPIALLRTKRVGILGSQFWSR